MPGKSESKIERNIDYKPSGDTGLWALVGELHSASHLCADLNVTVQEAERAASEIRRHIVHMLKVKNKLTTHNSETDPRLLVKDSFLLTSVSCEWQVNLVRGSAFTPRQFSWIDHVEAG
jgi:hypothetical protein